MQLISHVNDTPRLHTIGGRVPLALILFGEQLEAAEVEPAHGTKPGIILWRVLYGSI